MRKLLLVLMAAVLVTGGVVTPAAAAGPYLSINGGGVWVEDSDLSVEGFDDVAELSYDTGYVADVAFGNAFANGGRLELEVAYRENEIDELTIFGLGTGTVDGDVSSTAVMANGYYDFETGSAVKPFIGAGIGYANVELDSDGSEDDNVFAYQLMVGCGFAVGTGVTLDLQYRFFATDDPEFDDEGVTIESEYMTHNAMLGLRFHF